MSRYLLLFCCLFLMGCSSRHPVRTRIVVPLHCMHVTVTSFTKPCEDTRDGSMICDGVKVKIDCIAIEAVK